ncbi:lipopolysaccharide transport periplasmic protein LptA [Thermomonas brevis]
MSPSLEFPARALALALAVCGLAAAGTVAAKSSDRNQPMDIESDRSDCGLGDNASCTLVGNVSIAQGTMQVRAARAVIQQAGGNPSRAQLSGGVTLRQQLDDGGTIDAKSSNVDYDMRNEVVTFTGDVTINQARGTLTGQRVVYNMRTGQVQSGGEGGGRVKMRIMPKSAQTQGAG